MDHVCCPLTCRWTPGLFPPWCGDSCCLRVYWFLCGWVFSFPGRMPGSGLWVGSRFVVNRAVDDIRVCMCLCGPASGPYMAGSGQGGRAEIRQGAVSTADPPRPVPLTEAPSGLSSLHAWPFLPCNERPPPTPVLGLSWASVPVSRAHGHLWPACCPAPIPHPLARLFREPVHLPGSPRPPQVGWA